MSTLVTAYCFWLTGENSNIYSVQGDEACGNREKGKSKMTERDRKKKATLNHNS